MKQDISRFYSVVPCPEFTRAVLLFFPLGNLSSQAMFLAETLSFADDQPRQQEEAEAQFRVAATGFP
jgi:hypothetical protein